MPKTSWTRRYKHIEPRAYRKPRPDTEYRGYRGAQLQAIDRNAQAVLERRWRIFQEVQDPRFFEYSNTWAIAVIADVRPRVGPAGLARVVFELVNAETGVAHRLIFEGAGPGAGGIKRGRGTNRDRDTGARDTGQKPELPGIPGIPKVSLERSDYSYFELSRAMKFTDFHARGAHMTVRGVTGTGKAWFGVWNGNPFLSRPLAATEMYDDTFRALVLDLGFYPGRTTLLHGSGEPSIPFRPLGPEHSYTRPRETWVQISAQEPPLMIPSEALFDFDSAVLNTAADETLLDIGYRLNNRRSLPVTIAGHTDAVGDPPYNIELSRRRAEAVKSRFGDFGVHGVEDFLIRAYGSAHPIADNTHPDGSDNPDGRAQNRRVVVHAEWGLGSE